MSTESDREKERLKEEYKEHYRRIRDAKQRLKEVERNSRITQAVQNMNTENLMESVDEFLGKIREKVINVEARLDVAMDSLETDSAAADKLKTEELDEELKRHRARQTLQQVKAEMGILYSEIEKHAGEIKAEKTIGTKKAPTSSDENAPQSEQE